MKALFTDKYHVLVLDRSEYFDPNTGEVVDEEAEYENLGRSEIESLIGNNCISECMPCLYHL